jgi:predicted metal-dependent phosphoesterase TrpH
VSGKKVKGIQEVDMTTIKDIKLLENQLHLLEERIKEVEKRLPAHSVKPPIMVELLELEDERDKILSKLTALKQQPD